MNSQTAESIGIPPDPRADDDFQSDLLPNCDGDVPPSGNTTPEIAKGMIFFMSVYYHLNRLQNTLSSTVGHPPQGSRHSIQEELIEMKCSLRRLEDIYAPIGFIAEPEYVDQIAVNLEFTHVFKARQSNRHRIDVCVPTPYSS